MLRQRWNEFLLRIGGFLAKPRSRATVKKILIALFSATLVIGTYFLSVPYLGSHIDYQIGDIAREDIRIYQNIRYELPEETEKLKQEAYEKERFVFDRDYQVLRFVSEEIKTEMQILAKTGSEHNSYELALQRLDFLKKNWQYKPADVKEALGLANSKEIVPWAIEYATLVFDNYGLLNSRLNNEVLNKFDKVGALVKTINSSSGEEERIWDAERFIYHKNIFTGSNYQKLSSLGSEDFRKQISAGARSVVIRRILQHYFDNPYVRYNPVETEQKKEVAAKKVKPVTSVLKKGLTLVRAGDPIDKEKSEKIEILNKYQSQTNFKYLLGIFLIQLILAVAVSYYIFRFSEFKFRELSSHLILHSLIWVFFIFSFLVSRVKYVQNNEIYLALFVPVGFISTMLGIMFGARVTMALGVYISLFLFFLSGQELATLLLSFVTIITGIYAADHMKARTQFFKGAWVTGLAMGLVVLGTDMISNHWGSETRIRVILGFLNGYFGIILTTGILPIYETLFNLPTKFRLMELGDFNHPVLKTLAAEAPSTYTHSLMMANLSERAVAAIGGDSLLTRVGCLYHDIGKLKNPGFYAENKHLSPENEKMKSLGPQKSAKVIIDHVVDGIEMARAYRLPEKLISFIPEHHGTTTIQYFYHLALDNRANKNIKKEQFQYPGPRPQSKETGVVMIADSLEAASRTVEDPTPEKFKGLIETIINNKLKEDQFDECPLTLKDFKKIKEAFLGVLISSAHVRPKYPSMKQTQKLEDQQNNQSKAVTKSSRKPSTRNNTKKDSKPARAAASKTRPRKAKPVNRISGKSK